MKYDMKHISISGYDSVLVYTNSKKSIKVFKDKVQAIITDKRCIRFYLMGLDRPLVLYDE